jgi:ABC-type branched-subunit amino acid transport system substrate-binding protein
MKRRTLLIAAAAATCASPSRAEENIWRVGRSLPLSGPQAIYGEAKRDGADAYVAAVNARGGVAGRRIALHTADDAYDAARTSANITELAAAHDPVAFVGFFGIPPCLAAADTLSKLGIPGVGFTSGSNSFREAPRPEVFPVRASFAQECSAIVRHHKTVGVREAVIAFMDIPFGELARASFEQAARVEGLALAPAIQVHADGSNLRAAAATARAGSPLILMALQTPMAVAFARELRGLQSQQQLWCLSAVDTAVLQRQLGSAARGVASSVAFPPVDKLRLPIVREYLAATQAINRPATTFGLEAFIEMKTLSLGLSRSRGASGRDLVVSLEGAGRVDLGGFDVTYGAGNRTGSRYVDLVMVGTGSTVA